MIFALIFALGLVAGTAAGLLGIGGGILIVPALYALAPTLGIPDEIAMHAAVGTSLATIIPTSLISARGHYRKGAVDFEILKPWVPTLVIGIILAGLAAGPLHSDWLSLFFGVTALLVSAYMFFAKVLAGARSLPGKILQSLIAALIGAGSTLMGIGGGTLTVPTLTYFGVDTHRAVGTAAALGIAISLVGAFMFALSGFNAEGMPAGSLGFVYVPAALLIVLGTAISTPFGVWIAHRLDAALLRKVFAAFLALVAIRMIGAAI